MITTIRSFLRIYGLFLPSCNDLNSTEHVMQPLRRRRFSWILVLLHPVDHACSNSYKPLSKTSLISTKTSNPGWASALSFLGVIWDTYQGPGISKVGYANVFESSCSAIRCKCLLPTITVVPERLCLQGTVISHKTSMRGTWSITLYSQYAASRALWLGDRIRMMLARSSSSIFGPTIKHKKDPIKMDSPTVTTVPPSPTTYCGLEVIKLSQRRKTMNTNNRQ